jgi:RimJ/RimL family protein N-acetyltransferase
MEFGSRSSPIQWQPTLVGTWVRLRPLTDEDFETLCAVGSDPLIWEQHPEPDRWKREKFEFFFRTAIESKGALAIIDQKTGALIGTSRFTQHDLQKSCVEVGFTFLARSHWGKGYNHELKFLMLSYAFQFVDTASFYVGERNIRSQKAMIRIGATEVNRMRTQSPGALPRQSVIYEIKKADWATLALKLLPPFEQPKLSTPRLILEPIHEAHAEELWKLFEDPELHQFVPFDSESLEKQKQRCARWAKRRSPDGEELWLNWIVRDKNTGEAVAHLQSGMKTTGVASIGYVVARKYQGQGIATEGLKAIFSYLRESLGVLEIKAYSDTRNVASHRLAKKIGMIQVGFIRDADFFKGSSSDEFVFSDKPVQDSIRYLSSEEARKSIDINPYWPKWHSPWWHMATLFEMGLADLIPKRTVRHLIDAIHKQYPVNGDPAPIAPCPCELGNIFQILSSTGVDMSLEFPWMLPWLLDHQMPDGGLSCDEDAYHATPPASSIVGTIAPLEALLLSVKRSLTQSETDFLDRGAECLLQRRLILGCESKHNLEEKKDEADWVKPCFPRFYLYDTLRGLSFILKWASIRKKILLRQAIQEVVSTLNKKFPDGQVKIERLAFEGIDSRGKAASFFPLLNEISGVGRISPDLSAQWKEAREQIIQLENEGLIV